jgi:hypothetical protein
VFVLTMLVYVAALLGDEVQPINLRPDSPAKQAVLQHGVTVLLVETVLLVAVSFRAMAQDRRTTLARIQAQSDQSQRSPDVVADAASLRSVKT